MMNRFWKYRLDHLIFWLATILFHMFTRVDLIRQAGFGHFSFEILIRNGLLAVTIYTNLFVLIPAFVYRKKFLTYSISLAVLLVAYAFGKNIHDVHLYGDILRQPGRQDFFYNTFYNLSIAFFYVAFSIALQLSREWYNQRELIRKIEVEKLNTELAYLKAQINPHFLFNSINTIYFQIDKKNAEARHTLSRFSEMLRYQLYECNGHEVAIEKEVEYLNNYIQLQRLRKDENYEIGFSCSSEIKGFTIAPLLLICFIENAFKHISHHPVANVISVELARNEEQFRMKVYNTCDQREENIAQGAGIGLRNVKRRLELLYPERHSLKIDGSNNNFTVDLTLTIEMA